MCKRALQAVAAWVNDDDLAEVGISFRKDYDLKSQMVRF